MSLDHAECKYCLSLNYHSLYVSVMCVFTLLFTTQTLTCLITYHYVALCFVTLYMTHTLSLSVYCRSVDLQVCTPGRERGRSRRSSAFTMDPRMPMETLMLDTRSIRSFIYSVYFLYFIYFQLIDK